MTEAKKCRQCGANLPPATPQGLCPECLLKAGLSGVDAKPDAVASSDAESETIPVTPAAATASRSRALGLVWHRSVIWATAGC